MFCASPLGSQRPVSRLLIRRTSAPERSFTYGRAATCFVRARLSLLKCRLVDLLEQYTSGSALSMWVTGESHSSGTSYEAAGSIHLSGQLPPCQCRRRARAFGEGTGPAIARARLRVMGFTAECRIRCQQRPGHAV
jgi:hypothetical protein